MTVFHDVILSPSECPLPVLMKLFPFIFCFCDIYKNIELAYSSLSTHIHLERMDLTSFTLVLHWINDPSSPNERRECCWRHSISQKITRLHWLCDSLNSLFCFITKYKCIHLDRNLLQRLMIYNRVYSLNNPCELAIYTISNIILHM